MVRLKDIAERAGVSIMTVSKVLHDAPDISADTKARVRSLATQMGYVPDSMARGLRNRTTKLLGLVIPATIHPVFARVALAIEEKAFELGYELILIHTLNRPDREDSGIRKLVARRVDGLFVAPVYRFDQNALVYSELAQRRVPTVILGHKAPFCSQFFNVESDDLAASQTLTQHLIELGHKRIAYFGGSSVSPVAQERLEGYRRAHRESNLELDDRLIFDAGVTIEEGEKAALQMIQESIKPTAVMGVNDLVAIGAGNILLKQGFRIPQDISLVGFGNFMVAEYYRVPLSTVRQPKHRLGIAAMEVMKALLSGQQPQIKRLPAELCLRESTAAPGAVAAEKAV